MKRKSNRLDYEKMVEVGEETTNQSKHTKKSLFGSKSLRDDRYVFGGANLLGKCTVAYVSTPGKLQKVGRKNFKKM